MKEKRLPGLTSVRALHPFKFFQTVMIMEVVIQILMTFQWP